MNKMKKIKEKFGEIILLLSLILTFATFFYAFIFFLNYKV